MLGLTRFGLAWPKENSTIEDFGCDDFACKQFSHSVLSSLHLIHILTHIYWHRHESPWVPSTLYYSTWKREQRMFAICDTSCVLMLRPNAVTPKLSSTNSFDYCVCVSSSSLSSLLPIAIVIVIRQHSMHERLDSSCVRACVFLVKSLVMRIRFPFFTHYKFGLHLKLH